VPLRVVEIDVARELALCENADGERTTVEIALVDPVARHDVLLVHAGTAIARAAPEEVSP
jgi:hydrogenase maturation factor